MDWPKLESQTFWWVFCSAFLLTAMWETRHPNREWLISTGKRWTNHFLLYLASSVLRMTFTLLSPVGAALAAQKSGWGLFHQIDAPSWLAFLTAVLALDLTKYGMHRLFHALPFLWPIHRVHHSDPDFDVTTSVRFHPLELFLVQSADVGAIFLLGVPATGVFAAGVLSNLVNVTQHANANLPEAVEAGLRPLVFTARMHRIHHSDSWQDEHRNFGEVFPWWDGMFGTYTREAERGEQMQVGLEGYQDEKSMGLLEMLLQPLRAARKPQG